MRLAAVIAVLLFAGPPVDAPPLPQWQLIERLAPEIFTGFQTNAPRSGELAADLSRPCR